MTLNETLTDQNKNTGPAICWFREDLRVSDNPALSAACETGRDVLCIYIYDTFSRTKAFGGAKKWWLHKSLEAFSNQLIQLGGKLHILHGEAETLLPELVKNTQAKAIFWNRRYGEYEREIDGALKIKFAENELEVKSFNGHLMYEPWEIKTQAKTPMKVFTPFWRAARALRDVDIPCLTPKFIKPYNKKVDSEVLLENLKLLPTQPDWSAGMDAEWQPGAEGAKKRVAAFLSEGIMGYSEKRNLPGQLHTSKLSPHLHHGEISAREVWYELMLRVEKGKLKGFEKDVQVFQSELGWREFSYNLLFNFPKLDTENFQTKFNNFAFVRDDQGLKAWQRGQTGYPIVDAGMRQLWQTGWMHNRIRMVTASFLIKHLMIDWREGEAWFWDTLCEADLASNSASWQWVAGSGADAAPYYRIFNPVTQGEKFDSDGAYVRKFVPELAKLPQKYLHKPWTAPLSVLAEAGVKLGKNYPQPIVDHEFARKRALDSFKSISA